MLPGKYGLWTPVISLLSPASQAVPDMYAWFLFLGPIKQDKIEPAVNT
jgi:uncharacterized membrane protein YpjA